MIQEQRASLPASVDATGEMLLANRYLAGRSLSAAVYLALSLRRPLLLEGESGVGKTALAESLATSLGRRFLRLQCFDGLDLAGAAYEWNYPKQMMAIRLAESRGLAENMEADLYSEDYLLERPLLAALKTEGAGAPVLLIDEIDRADEPFEAFLLEFLSEYQLSIPEFGTVRASEPPVVVITSNRTRDIHDALRRRCLYHWVRHPTAEAEERIVALHTEGLSDGLRRQLVRFVQALRQQDLYKSPGVAETLDWSRALLRLSARRLTTETVNDTLGLLLKYEDDIVRVRDDVGARVLADIDSEG